MPRPEQAEKGFSGYRTAYPELRAVVGANVPDLRGLFLRGTGGNAAALGTVQEDAGRNVTGTAHNMRVFRGGLYSGAFYNSSYVNSSGFTGSEPGSWGGFTMDASRVWGTEHTANEFRPKNRAVRYLIRAMK